MKLVDIGTYENVYDDHGISLTVLHEDAEYYYVLNSGAPLMKIRKTKTFANKMDAMYYNFIEAPTPVKNFKKSKYYDYYIARAKVENPERLI